MKSTTQVTTRFIPFALVTAVALLGSAAAEARDEGYGYYRILEGTAERYGVTDEERGVSENEPLLEGDRVTVDRGSRLEVVLPDFSRMRLGEYSDVDFERLRAVDNRAEEYRIRLFEGEVQVTLDERPDEFLLETDVASIYLLEGGSYRVSGRADEATVVVREGYAEILTEAGSAVARAGEKVVVRGFDDSQVWVEEAGSADSLERWAEANERDAERVSQGSDRYVDDDLGYAAADLDREGEWLDVGGSYAWRPMHRQEWNRPYHSGYWYDTPYGIHWVSQYRWGWLTSHYGYWDFDSHFGWVWYPGAAYSPAWVHWYWGPSYVGWIPSGYYYRHFGHFGYNYYGHIGHGGFGHHGHNRFWTFHDRHKFGHHHRKRFYYDDVDVVPRHTLEGGIITTDTRGLRRRHWNQVDETNRILTRNASRTRGGLTYRHPEDLPDAVSYVTRRASALPIDSGQDNRLGPVEQVARTRAATGNVGGDSDSAFADGLIVRRGTPSATGTGIESRPVVNDQGLTSTRARGDSDRRVIVRGDDDERLGGARERVEADRSRSRVVLPSSPPVLDRGRSDSDREASARDGDRRVVGRSDRVERRDGWQIERRAVQERESVRERPTSSGEDAALSRRPASGSSERNPSTRPRSHERPSAGYDRSERSRPAPRATPRSAPTRRYDRPSSGRSSSPRASSRPSSSRSSSASSGRSQSSSSSSGSSSRSSSSDGGGKAARSRSDGD